MNRKNSGIFAASLMCASIACASSALAQQTYPSKPIKIIVPFSAGGGGDLIARKVGTRLAERTGVSVVVENRAGASGNIGAELVVKSPPDGYTVMSTSSTFGIQAALAAKLSYDPFGDLTPLIAVTRTTSIILVNAASPIRTLRDLSEAGKRQPGKLTYGTAGVGAIAHLQTEELASKLGIKMTHVPYKGTSQAFTDLLGGVIDVIFANPVMAANLVRSGRAHALAIGGEKRLPALSEVPTFIESGLKDYSPSDWKAMLGPKGIPPEIVAKFNSEVNAILKEPAFSAVLAADGSTAIGGSPDELVSLIKSDVERWRALVRERHIQIE